MGLFEAVDESAMRLTVGTRGKKVALIVSAIGHGTDGGDAVFEVDLSSAEAREVAAALIVHAEATES